MPSNLLLFFGEISIYRRLDELFADCIGLNESNADTVSVVVAQEARGDAAGNQGALFELVVWNVKRNRANLPNL